MCCIVCMWAASSTPPSAAGSPLARTQGAGLVGDRRRLEGRRQERREAVSGCSLGVLQTRPTARPPTHRPAMTESSLRYRHLCSAAHDVIPITAPATACHHSPNHANPMRRCDLGNASTHHPTHTPRALTFPRPPSMASSVLITPFASTHHADSSPPLNPPPPRISSSPSPLMSTANNAACGRAWPAHLVPPTIPCSPRSITLPTRPSLRTQHPHCDFATVNSNLYYLYLTQKKLSLPRS